MKTVTLVLLLAVVLSACAPAARAQAIPAGWQIFESKRYHYKAAFPPNWEMLEGVVEWSALEVARPLGMGIDTYYSKDANASDTFKYTWIMVSAHALDAGETLEKWADRYPTVFVAPDSDYCKSTEPSTRIKIGQEETILFNHYCESGSAKLKAHTAMLTHGKQGYVVAMWNPPDTNTTDMATFQQFWSSLVFTQ